MEISELTNELSIIQQEEYIKQSLEKASITSVLNPVINLSLLILMDFSRKSQSMNLLPSLILKQQNKFSDENMINIKKLKVMHILLHI